MSQADLEAYMWQRVPGAPEAKFNPFRKVAQVPAERDGPHKLLGVGQRGASTTMAMAPRGGVAGSMVGPSSGYYGPRAGAVAAHLTANGSSNPAPPQPPSLPAHVASNGMHHPPKTFQNYNAIPARIDMGVVMPPGAPSRGSPVSSIPKNPLAKKGRRPKGKKARSKHAPPLPTEPGQTYPDIPMPSAKGTENPFLQAYDELAKEDKYQDFEGPAMWDGPVCWNPREGEMHNMQDWHTERQAFLKKLDDPRRRYLARYTQIRESLCSNRFRNPEYARIVPGTCTPTANPWNYAQGPPSMFGSAPLGDQSMSDGIAVQRSIGNVPIHQWLSGGDINTHNVYSTTSSSGSYSDYVVAPTQYASQNYVTCPANASYDSTTGVCVSHGSGGASQDVVN